MGKGGHWADACADSIVRARGDKEAYVCASGLTPLGSPSLTSFREALSVDFVARALRDKGKRVRFAFSWDEYDVFRKVPKGEHPALAAFLRMPVSAVPDPSGKAEGLARRFEREFEQALSDALVRPEYIRQAERYASGAYAHGIRIALREAASIKRVLDSYRNEKLSPDWSPLTVFCSRCSRDTTEFLSWDGEWNARYRCASCGIEEEIDVRSTPLAKPYWRIEWPMRWTWEGTDFEPARKDHHAHGGSFDTAAEIARIAYGRDAPESFVYGHLTARPAFSLRARDGAPIDGNDPRAALSIYEPEVLRFFVARAKPSTDLCLPYDVEIFGAYEAYDRAERSYYGLERIADADEAAKERRLYELAQGGAAPRLIPYQAPFRSLCEIAMLNGLDPGRTVAALPNLPPDRLGRVLARTERAIEWIRLWAPGDFAFTVRNSGDAAAHMDARELECVSRVAAELADAPWDERSIEAALSRALEGALDARVLHRALCKACVSREHGPKATTLALGLGRERTLALLREAARQG
jgi:lysyl-tRNA synthetase class 1